MQPESTRFRNQGVCGSAPSEAVRKACSRSLTSFWCCQQSPAFWHVAASLQSFCSRCLVCRSGSRCLLSQGSGPPLMTPFPIKSHRDVPGGHEVLGGIIQPTPYGKIIPFSFYSDFLVFVDDWEFISRSGGVAPSRTSDVDLVCGRASGWWAVRPGALVGKLVIVMMNSWKTRCSC